MTFPAPPMLLFATRLCLLLALSGCAMLDYDPLRQRDGGGAGGSARDTGPHGRGDGGGGPGRPDGSRPDSDVPAAGGKPGDAGGGSGGIVIGVGGILIDDDAGAGCGTTRCADSMTIIRCTDDGPINEVCPVENDCQRPLCTEEESCDVEWMSNNTSCDDQDPCTVGDHCEDGECEGDLMDCSDWDSPCGEGRCQAGACFTDPYADGSLCRNEPVGVSCEAGECIGYAQCTPSAPCPLHECTAPGIQCGYECEPNTSCDLLCRTGAQCEQFCRFATECENGCEGGAVCTVDCFNAGHCLANCGSGAECDVDCTQASICGPLYCTDEAICNFTCRATGNCGPIFCETGATCVVQCAGSGACELNCASGAQCSLQASDNITATFTCAAGGEMTCADGTQTCNMDCPAPGS